MLGYRHVFHAANHADTLKHLALFHCLRHLIRKDKPLLYLDTHAGAGGYRLEEGRAAENREWDSGLSVLIRERGAAEFPQAAAEYLRFVEDYSGRHTGEYPGSPAMAAAILRPQDRLVLRELHPADFDELRLRFAADARVQVLDEDGYKAVRSVLPPTSRRGLILLDPSYETAPDYDRTADALADGLERFATGTFLVWYPILERPEARALPGRLKALAGRPWLAAELKVRSSFPGERGLAGSGIVVVNPPWPLGGALRSALPFLSRILGRDAGASWDLSGPASITG